MATGDEARRNVQPGREADEVQRVRGSGPVLPQPRVRGGSDWAVGVTPVFDRVVEEHGDPAEIEPTPTLDDLLRRHPVSPA